MDSYIFAVHDDLSQDIYLSKSIIATGKWEPSISAITVHLLKNYASQKDKVHVLNIGGNIGWYSILTAMAAPNVTVDSFEPCSKNYTLLCENIQIHALQDRINAHCCAIADVPSKGKLYLDATNAGDNALIEQNRKGGYEEIDITSLDTFYSTSECCLPDICIIDTQGCEQRIFEGARQLFSKNWRPLLFLEFWPGGMDGHGSAVSYPQRLHELGYTFYRMNPRERSMTAISAGWLLNFAHELLQNNNQEGFIDICAVPPHMDIKALLS